MSSMIVTPRASGAMCRDATGRARTIIDAFVDLTLEEHMVYEAVEAYISQTYDKASAKERNAVGFVMTVYRRRLASSFSALEHTLNDTLRALSDPREEWASRRLTLRNRRARRIAYSLDELDMLLNAPELLPAGTDASPLDPREYRYSQPGMHVPQRVTTSRQLYEDHPRSLELCSPGGALLPKVSVAAKAEPGTRLRACWSARDTG